jgi:hypothetical protein
MLMAWNTLKFIKEQTYETPEFDEAKNYLWPIPLEIISQNPEYGQNPGWDVNR